MSIEYADTKDLIPLSQAIREEIPGEPSYSTVWRWIRRGLAPAIPSEPRIKLSVKYVGSKPFTSRTLIQDFIERATRARLARMARDEQQTTDVSDAELAAVGLTSPN